MRLIMLWALTLLCLTLCPAAESIVGRTARGMYLVKRQGLGLDQYGLVDGRAVKRQRLGQAAPEGEEAPAPPPIDVAMVRRVLLRTAARPFSDRRCPYRIVDRLPPTPPAVPVRSSLSPPLPAPRLPPQYLSTLQALDHTSLPSHLISYPTPPTRFPRVYV